MQVDEHMECVQIQNILGEESEHDRQVHEQPHVAHEQCHDVLGHVYDDQVLGLQNE